MSRPEFKLDQDEILKLYRSDPATLRRAIELEVGRARTEAMWAFGATIVAALRRINWLNRAGRRRTV